MKHETLMHWINRIYSFIHIPGTILFLGWLYYHTTVRNRVDERQEKKDIGEVAGSPVGPALYQARRRAMAVCNLLAFIVFTAWPCMPPRLLSDPSAQGADAEEGRTYGFVDTVHGKEGESSVWTQNKFCNQYGRYALTPHVCSGFEMQLSLTSYYVPYSCYALAPLRVFSPYRPHGGSDPPGVPATPKSHSCITPFWKDETALV